MPKSLPPLGKFKAKVGDFVTLQDPLKQLTSAENCWEVLTVHSESGHTLVSCLGEKTEEITQFGQYSSFWKFLGRPLNDHKDVKVFWPAKDGTALAYCQGQLVGFIWASKQDGLYKFVRRSGKVSGEKTHFQALVKQLEEDADRGSLIEQEPVSLFSVFAATAEGSREHWQIAAVDDKQATACAKALGAEGEITLFPAKPLSPERYLAALERMRAFIASGEKLDYFDDTTPGDKSTACTWGLCSDAARHWPDPEDHSWPGQFMEGGRIAPKSLRKELGHRCPMDLRDRSGVISDPNGCFYTCRIFQRGQNPDQAQALALYDQAIAEQVAAGQDELTGFILAKDILERVQA